MEKGQPVKIAQPVDAAAAAAADVAAVAAVLADAAAAAPADVAAVAAVLADAAAAAPALAGSALVKFAVARVSLLHVIHVRDVLRCEALAKTLSTSELAGCLASFGEATARSRDEAVVRWCAGLFATCRFADHLSAERSAYNKGWLKTMQTLCDANDVALADLFVRRAGQPSDGGWLVGELNEYCRYGGKPHTSAILWLDEKFNLTLAADDPEFQPLGAIASRGDLKALNTYLTRHCDQTFARATVLTALADACEAPGDPLGAVQEIIDYFELGAADLAEAGALRQTALPGVENIHIALFLMRDYKLAPRMIPLETGDAHEDEDTAESVERLRGWLAQEDPALFVELEPEAAAEAAAVAEAEAAAAAAGSDADVDVGSDTDLESVGAELYEDPEAPWP